MPHGTLRTFKALQDPMAGWEIPILTDKPYTKASISGAMTSYYEVAMIATSY